MRANVKQFNQWCILLTKLVVNSKLALPGLAILARAAWYDSFDIDDSATKYIAETLKSFKRIDTDSSAIKTVIEELSCSALSDDSVAAMRKTIAALVKSLRSDPTANQNMIELYNVVSGVFAGDAKHFITLRDKISLLGIPSITALFPVEVDTSKQADYLQFVASFSSEQLAELREQKDVQYKAVVSAKRAGKTVVADYIKQYCRSAGKTFVDYAALYASVEAQQLSHTLPSGFEGFIDEFSQLYTRYGKKIAGFPSNATVEMNPQYSVADDCYVFTARSELARSTTYFYTQDYKNTSKQNKFSVVEKLSKCIDTIRSKWIRKLKESDPCFEEAAVLELIYHTQARIGSSGNATLDKRTGKYLRTYGMSTLLRKHVSIVDDSYVLFEYPGKAAYKGDVVHLQSHKFYPDSDSSKLLFKWLKKQSAKPEDERLFSTTAERVRDLLKELGAPEGASVHKLRTLKGTLMMKERIKTHPFKQKKTSATAVNKWLKEQALGVGIQLGHMSGEKYTASTAIAHYIDPVAMLRLYREAGVAPPKTMLKLVGIDSYSIEAVK